MPTRMATGRQVGDRRRAPSSSALLAPRLGARSRRKSLLRQHRLGVNAQGGPSSYEPTVGPAPHRALAEGSDADGGWQHRAANVGNASGRGHKPHPGESVSALCVRHVDGGRCPHIPFERYADDAICHCKSAEEAQVLWSALADRFAACKLVLHPEKTKIVYCKDANRRGDFPIISRLSGIPVSGPEDDVEGRHEAHLRAQLPTRRQPEGVDVH